MLAALLCLIGNHEAITVKVYSIKGWGGGVHGREIGVVALKLLALIAMGFESCQGLLSCEDTIQPAYECQWVYSHACLCLK